MYCGPAMDESGSFSFSLRCVRLLRIGVCFVLLCCFFSAATCDFCWGCHHSTASVVGINRGAPEPFLASDLLYYDDGHVSEFRCTAIRIRKQGQTDKWNHSLLLPCNSSSHFAAFPSLQKQIQQHPIIKATSCLLFPRPRPRHRLRHRHRHRPTITFSHRRQLNLDGTQMPTTSSLKPGFRRYAFIGSLLSSFFLFQVLRPTPSVVLKNPLSETLKNCRRPLLKALSTEKKEKSNKRKKKRSKQPNMVLLGCSPKVHSSSSSSLSSLSLSSMSDISPCESSSSPIPSMKQLSGGCIRQTSSSSSCTIRESKGYGKGPEMPTPPSSPPLPLPEAISPISLGGMAITTTLLSTSSSRISPEARAPGSSLLRKKGGFFSPAAKKDERGFLAMESDTEVLSGSNKEDDLFVYNIWGNHFAEINNHSAFVSSGGLPFSRSFFSRSEFSLSSHSLPSSPTFSTSDSLFSHHSPEFISTPHKPRIPSS